jgi:hypothetical protein
MSRFGALVDTEEAGGLVKKLTEAKRLARPATEEPSRFSEFDLTYEQAAHLVLLDKQGKELVHLLVGKGQNTSSDFIRYSGKDALPGVYELVDAAGVMETLRSRLHLDAEGKPEVRSWVDTGAFKTLPREAEVSRLTIADKAVQIEAESQADPKDAAKRIWQVVKPEASYGNSAALDGALEAIRNMRGTDVAGKPGAQGSELGVINAERWVEIKYSVKGGKTETMRLDFGKTKDHDVAVWVTSESKGEFIWWANDYVLTRVFRPAVDFTDVAPLPPPGPAVTELARVQQLLVGFIGTPARLKKSRTKAEARRLVQEVLEKAQEKDADWARKGLQRGISGRGSDSCGQGRPELAQGFCRRRVKPQSRRGRLVRNRAWLLHHQTPGVSDEHADRDTVAYQTHFHEPHRRARIARGVPRLQTAADSHFLSAGAGRDFFDLDLNAIRHAKRHLRRPHQHRQGPVHYHGHCAGVRGHAGVPGIFEHRDCGRARAKIV